MNRKKVWVVVLVGLSLLWASLAVNLALAAAPPKVVKVVYLTASKGCPCTVKQARAADEVVAKIFTGPRQALLERIDYAVETDKAKPYIQQYHLYTVPVIVFLDEKQGLLSHLSSLTRLRRRSTSAHDSERSRAIRTRAETARKKGRDNRGSVHVSERPLLSWKDCLCDRICSASARNSECLCHYADARACRCKKENSSRRPA